MIGLDTNVLARYYVQDESDAEATRQHETARRLIESGKPLMVAKTVLLELEWVMRGYYGFSTEQVAAALRHLISLPQVVIEQREVSSGGYTSRQPSAYDEIHALFPEDVAGFLQDSQPTKWAAFEVLLQPGMAH